MASITGTSSSSILTSMSNSRISGLASGMDTDGLVESMTAITRGKIAKFQQQKQLASWKMDAFRSISSKMIALQSKFTSYSSSTNLRSPSFFSKSVITASGTNSKYVTATGNGDNAGSVRIAAVTQLAQNTSYVSKNTVSSGTLQGSEAIDPKTGVDVSKLAGESIKFKYGTKTFSIRLDASKEYNSVEDVADELNRQLAEQEYGGKFNSYADIVKISAVGNETDGYSLQIGFQEEAKDLGNGLTVENIGSNLSSLFGIEEGAEALQNSTDPAKNVISGSKVVKDNEVATATENKELKSLLAGKSLTFSYNGQTATIRIPEARITEKDENGKEVDKGVNTDWLDADGNVDMKKLGECLQKQLNKEFGSGRVTVNMDAVPELDTNGNPKVDTEGNTVYTGKYTLGFTATVPGKTGEEAIDKTSVLKITGGDTATLTAFGLKEGASNRMNVNAALSESGLNAKGNGFANLNDPTDPNNENKRNDYAITIVDKISKEVYVIDKTVDGTAFNKNTTMKEIMEAINASDAGVKVSYLETADKLSIESTQSGASGNFAIVGSVIDGDNNISTDYDDYFKENGALRGRNTANLGTEIFGYGIKGHESSGNGKVDGVSEYTITEGKDAEIWVDYDGEGGTEPMKITRSSNSFDLNGMNVTVSGKFGEVSMVDGKEKVTSSSDEAVTFESKVDTEKITTAVKEMITAYNEVIELANKLVSEKRDRDYQPLTDEQREEMSEDEIKKWEEKAKAGMLFNNSELRAFTGEIRFLFSKTAEMTAQLKEMGITTATSYSGAGKVNFDENAFKAALEKNPEKVKEMFTATEKSYTDEKGNKVVTETGGLMAGIKSVFDKYSATDSATKGIFVQMAGATESPLSMLNNNIQKQMDSYDDMIEKLKDKLEDEAERYYKQFSSMEVYINNMNSQSSWLAQQFGGY